MLVEETVMENSKQSNNDETHDIGSSELSPGSGSLLADARKKQQRTVEEIASELNLSVTQIRTIESDQSEGLPEPTYVRGYIRSYAKLLGLTPEVVLENYKNPNWQKSANLDDMPRGIGSAEMSESGGFFSGAKIVGFLAVASIVAFLWYSGLVRDWFSSDEVASQVETAQSVSDIESDNQAVDITGSPEETVGAVEADVTNNTALANSASVTNEIVLSFSATSWVDIRDAEDNRLAYKSYTRGEELIIPIENRISVFIGNAEGVNVQYNGEPYDISRFREGVYAKFVME